MERVARGMGNIIKGNKNSAYSQLDIGFIAVCESIVFTMQDRLREDEMQKDEALLNIDLIKVFNLVSRQAMLAAIARFCPFL